MSSQPSPWPAPDDDDAAAGPSSLPPPPPAEKKPRKKWSQEETQMLVDGCNRVSSAVASPAAVLISL
jgi:hypothetical protein